MIQILMITKSAQLFTQKNFNDILKLWNLRQCSLMGFVDIIKPKGIIY